MGRPIHFEIPADDPVRARAFYASALGWEIESSNGGVEYYLVSTGDRESPGIDGAIAKRFDPVATTVNTVAVESLDETLAKVEAAGGSVVVGRRAVTGIGWHAYCRDTEGNVFGLLEADESAT